VSKLSDRLKGTIYTFFELDRKTYYMEINLKMFICRGYNGGEGGIDDVSVVYNRWKYVRREMVDCKM